MRISKLTSLLLTLTLIVTLFLASGCQSHQQDKQVTTLTFWHGINPPSNRLVFEQLVNKFNHSHPHIKVEALYIGQPDTQLAKILTAIVGNQPPDLLWFVPQLTGELVELGAILPLENWLNNSPLKAEIEPNLLPAMELNQHIWSIPLGTNNNAIFYRPSLFKKAGINHLPTTWQELEETAKKLTIDKDNDGRIDQYGLLLSLGKEEWVVFVNLPFIYSAKGYIWKNQQPNLVNSGTIKALEFISQLVKDQVIMLSPPERGYELDNFLAGKVAMQITGPWTLNQLRQSQVDFGVFSIPKLDVSATILGGENVFIFKTNPEKEQAAIKFLEYILSEEFQKTWAMNTGYLPINVKAKNSPEYQAFVAQNPVLKVFLEQMKWAYSRPIISGYTNLSENLGRAIETTIMQKNTPQKALEQSQKRLELIFNEK